MQWEVATLPTATEPGYGERVLPAEEMVKRDGGEDSPGRPTFIWFCDKEQKFVNEFLETQIFQNEPIAISLRKLRCVRIDVATITDPKLKAEYGKTPAFRLIDPKGECLSKVDGKGNIVAVPKVSGMIKKGWAKMFTVSQGSFVRKMTKILDGYDRISAKRNQASRNNDSRQEKLSREEDQLRKQESDLLTACALKKTYLPAKK